MRKISIKRVLSLPAVAVLAVLLGLTSYTAYEFSDAFWTKHVGLRSNIETWYSFATNPAPIGNNR